MDIFFDEVIAKIKKRRLLSRIIMMTISLLISALVFNLLLLPTKLVSGGVNGISTITNYVYAIEPSIMILLISLACIVFSYMYLGKERTAGTLMASLLYPLFVQLTSLITRNVYIDHRDMFLIVVFAGVITGFANGLMYRTGFSNGGLPVISQILYKYYKIPIAKSSLVINSVIIIIGGIFFGWTMVMYAIILLYINSIIIDKVLIGISKNKAFYIITAEEKEVKKYILEKLKHSVTIFNVKGAFLEKKRKVLLTVIPSREYYKVTEGIKLIDNKAFFVVTDSYEVKGGK